ncbi:MAG: rhodanese-like domain-containing protein [Pseudomonadota bacterium]
MVSRRTGPIMLERIPEFVSNHPIMSLGFIALLLALIVTEVARRFRAFKDVTPTELTRLINADDAAVLDVSAHNDFEKGHIPNALHVAMSQLDPEGKTLSKLKGKPVVVYCKTGQFSEQAAKKLAAGGFERVYWLSGGLQSWINDQLPVATGKK